MFINYGFNMYNCCKALRSSVLDRFSPMLNPPHPSITSLLLSKPEAAQKALSENSLLKNIEFNEKFLGEENITEGRLIIYHYYFQSSFLV